MKTIIRRGLLLAVIALVAAPFVVLAGEFPIRSANVFAPAFTSGWELFDGASPSQRKKLNGEVKETAPGSRVWAFPVARGEDIAFKWNAQGNLGGAPTALSYCLNGFNSSNGATGEVSGYFAGDTDLRLVCIGLGGGVALRIRAKVYNIDIAVINPSVDGTHPAVDATHPQGTIDSTFLVGSSLPVTVSVSVTNKAVAPLRYSPSEIAFEYSESQTGGAGTTIDIVEFSSVAAKGVAPVKYEWVPPSNIRNKDLYIRGCIIEGGSGPLFYDANKDDNCSGWGGPYKFVAS